MPFKKAMANDNGGDSGLHIISRRVAAIQLVSKPQYVARSRLECQASESRWNGIGTVVSFKIIFCPVSVCSKHETRGVEQIGRRECLGA